MGNGMTQTDTQKNSLPTIMTNFMSFLRTYADTKISFFLLYNM